VSPRGARGRGANLLLALASLLAVGLLLVGSEMAVRRANPRYLERISLDDLAYLHTYSPVYGWTPRPSFRYTLAGSETTINRLGYRGREVAWARTPGRPRIVMLGDSITFGYGVRDGETFSAVMETLDPRLEVVNLGVQGYGTDQELLKLEREGFAYAPDIVVLNVCLANDLLDNASARSIYDGVYPKPYFRLEEGRLVEVAGHVALSPPRRLALLYPSLRDFVRPSRRAQRFLEAPELRGVKVVDLRPRFEAAGFNADTFPRYSLDGNLHLTPEGHRLAARVILEVLDEEGLLRVATAIGMKLSATPRSHSAPAKKE